jgi:hypothetical protein
MLAKIASSKQPNRYMFALRAARQSKLPLLLSSLFPLVLAASSRKSMRLMAVTGFLIFHHHNALPFKQGQKKNIHARTDGHQGVNPGLYGAHLGDSRTSRKV